MAPAQSALRHPGTHRGLPQLGLPELGSFLWRTEPSSTPDLDGPRPSSPGTGVHLQPAPVSRHMLHRLLAERPRQVLPPGRLPHPGHPGLRVRVRITADLHPFFDTQGRTELRSSSGADRKQTGSYYTPDSLVQCLLDSALEPVLKKRLEGKSAQEQEQALLSMKVCDPAVGSGHFLISAAHRLAYRLSRSCRGIPSLRLKPIRRPSIKSLPTASTGST